MTTVITTKQFLISFLIGFGASLTTSFYLGWGFHKTKHEKSPNLHFEILMPLVAITLGIANMINIYFEQKYNWLIGILIGILFSSYGIYLNFPQKYYNITETQARIFAIIIYFSLFVFYTKYMNNKLL